MLGLIRS